MAKSKNWTTLALSIQAALTHAANNWLEVELANFKKEDPQIKAADEKAAKRDNKKALKKISGIQGETLEAFANKYGFTKPEEVLNAITMVLDVLSKYDFMNTTKAAKAYHLEALNFQGVAFAGVPLVYPNFTLAKGIYTKAVKSRKVAK